MAVLTVFTPAYNRAHTIKRTYESLCAQNNKDFVWLVVDDGSTDNTSDLISKWQKNDNGFEIRYIYKENGGMHTAHNVAYENIDTELNVCIDSDDALADDAVEKIISKWNCVKDKDYAGIIGLNIDFNGKIIGKGFSEGLSETTLVGYYASGGYGDKKLVYRTDVINSVPPYPVFEGERYVALAYKYRLIDQKYKLAVLDEPLGKVDYQNDGSTATMWKQYLAYPNGFAFWRKICMQYPMNTKRKIVDCIHYCSSSIIAKNKHFIVESPCKFLTFLCTPVGLIFSGIVKYKAKVK